MLDAIGHVAPLFFLWRMQLLSVGHRRALVIGLRRRKATQTGILYGRERRKKANGPG